MVYIAPCWGHISESKTNWRQKQGTSAAAPGSGLEIQSLGLDPNSPQVPNDLHFKI